MIDLGGKLTQLRSNEWFLVPTSIVDLYLERLGARGLALYCIVARQCIQKTYPSPEDLSSLLKASPLRVKGLIKILWETGLLNDSDVLAICGSESRSLLKEEREAISLGKV